MEAPNDSCNAWLGLASSCLSDSLWELVVQRPETSMSHRPCPWGGHLVKIDCRNVFIQGTLKDPSYVLIRPEVRGQYEGAPVEISTRCLEVYGPGDAMLERHTRMWLVRMASVLFGHCSHDKGHDGKGMFYDFDINHHARHQMKRNYPEQHDCSYVGQGSLWVSRPEAGATNRFRIVLVFRTPDEKRFAPWLFPLFSMITDMTRKAQERTLNSQAYQEMRRIDAELYAVLSMRSFNRGPPMIPQHPGEGVETFKIAAGKTLGLNHWSRFPLSETGRFCLADYMKRFAEYLGFKLTAYNSLDGRRLVNYQCVVKRQDWEKVKTAFCEAFRIQKAAYRHANGGSTAPGLTEDALPHVLSDLQEQQVVPETTVLKTVVRNTFLELDEEVHDSPPMRRTRSDLSSDVITYTV